MPKVYIIILELFIFGQETSDNLPCTYTVNLLIYWILEWQKESPLLRMEYLQTNLLARWCRSKGYLPFALVLHQGLVTDPVLRESSAFGYYGDSPQIGRHKMR